MATAIVEEVKEGLRTPVLLALHTARWWAEAFRRTARRVAQPHPQRSRHRSCPIAVALDFHTQNDAMPWVNERHDHHTAIDLIPISTWRHRRRAGRKP